jgi:hypothetical protein
MIRSFPGTSGRLTGISESAFVVYLKESTTKYIGTGKKLLEDSLKEENKKIFQRRSYYPS